MKWGNVQSWALQMIEASIVLESICTCLQSWVFCCPRDKKFQLGKIFGVFWLGVTGVHFNCPYSISQSFRKWIIQLPMGWTGLQRSQGKECKECFQLRGSPEGVMLHLRLDYWCITEVANEFIIMLQPVAAL